MFSPFIDTILIFGGINAMMALGLYLPLSAGQLSLAQGGFMAIGAYTSAVLTRNLGVPFGFALLGFSKTGMRDSSIPYLRQIHVNYNWVKMGCQIFM